MCFSTIIFFIYSTENIIICKMFSTTLLLIIFVINIIIAYIVTLVKHNVMHDKSLSFNDYASMMILGTFLVVGGYQLYFWTKSNYRPGAVVATICYQPIDDAIPYLPSFSYIYSLLYYPMFAVPLLLIDDYKDFVKFCVGGLSLMMILSTIWYLFPNKVPDTYRQYSNRNTSSERFLKFVQEYDSNENNAFPSAHCAFAMYIAAICISKMTSKWKYIMYLFPLLIAISCVVTKQHSFVDTIVGILIGWAIGTAIA